MDAIDHPPFSHDSSFVLCPDIRFMHQQGNYNLKDGNRYGIIKKSYRSSEPQNEHCLRPLHGEKNSFTCNACWLTTVGTTYYICDKYKDIYHKECVEAPAEIYVPGYHLKHPLQLSVHISHRSRCRMVSHCCGNLNVGYFYYCSICDFSMHAVCASKPTLRSIDHPKCHEHTLMYFHRKASLTCNVCGFEDERYFIYICLQCEFIVHKACIYLPRVIMLTRHDHRLSIISAFPCGNWVCRVCHNQMNISYGGYICMKGCEFAVHCSCATQRHVWDGRELEGEPDEDEDVMSFKKFDDGTIQYFSHPKHPLKLFEKPNGVFGENTYCQACILPLHDENAYKCETCDFNLHQTCAYLPLRKRHLLHIHPLILQKDFGTHYDCGACSRRIFTGFTYACSKGCDFNMDIRCSMVSEPFNYLCHPHPLFLGTRTGPGRSCWMCSKSSTSDESLYCIVCDFSLCFSCATLPYKVRYKHDNHFLKLSHVISQVEEYWCEICEQEINTGGVYACSSCSITLHIVCAIGNLYDKPGHTIQDGKYKIEFSPSNSLTRPICSECHCHCQYKLLYKMFKNESCIWTLCSSRCLSDKLEKY